MKFAYIRVSSTDQSTGRQHEALKQYTIDRVFEEKLSGKDTDRPELKALLEYVRDNDTVYIESISRLARNTLDFLSIVEQLTQKNVSLVSLKENIDTSTPQGKFMLSVFAALSQLERDTIRQRQREGIDLVKQTGMTKTGKAYGRPKAMPANFCDVYKRWKAGKMTAVAAMKETGLSKNTFYLRVKEREQVQ